MLKIVYTWYKLLCIILYQVFESPKVVVCIIFVYYYILDAFS